MRWKLKPPCEIPIRPSRPGSGTACPVTTGLQTNYLFGCFFLFVFWLHHAVHGILVPQPGSNPHPLQWKCRIVTTGIPKLIICTFKVAQGRMKHSFGNCVHYLCGSSRRPFLSYPMSPPLSHYSSLSFTAPSPCLCVCDGSTHHLPPGGSCAVSARLFPGNGSSHVKFCPQTSTLYLPCLLTVSAAAASSPAGLWTGIGPTPEAQGKPWWYRPHLCTPSRVLSSPRFAVAQLPFSLTQTSCLHLTS